MEKYVLEFPVKSFMSCFVPLMTTAASCGGKISANEARKVMVSFEGNT